MTQKNLTYQGKDIVVKYDVARCIHAAECSRGLPEVFDPAAKPWIKPDGASSDKVAEVIARCPTGALSFERQDGGPAEAIPDQNTVTVAANGPLYLRGQIEIMGEDGTLQAKEIRAALCRCGASKNKPYCDGSHDGAGFRDDGEVSGGQAGQDNGAGTLTVSCYSNGPFGLAGPADIRDAFGEPCATADGAALCRCGHSDNKPFCDGSHRRVGFVSS